MRPRRPTPEGPSAPAKESANTRRHDLVDELVEVTTDDEYHSLGRAPQ